MAVDPLAPAPVPTVALVPVATAPARDVEYVIRKEDYLKRVLTRIYRSKSHVAYDPLSPRQSQA